MLAKEGKSDINDYVPKGGSYKYSDGQADSDQWVVGGDMKVNRVLSKEETRAIQKEMGVTDLPYRDEVASILGRELAEGGLVMDDYIVGKKMSGPARQKLSEGGMSKQMDMFQDGGLEQDGGTVDPVSGNNVPPGSAQEEVRDDIPAQLSEGEFVFPADVVRFIGLEKLMRLRQEAKMGLKMMEEMGQMGNADEAIMPDDLPFDINDLDMDGEIEDNNEIEMQAGGVVPGQGFVSIPPGIPTPQQQVSGISGFQQAAAPTTGVAAVPQAASQAFVQPVVRPAQAAVPTMQQFDQQNIPSFSDFTGGNFGGYDELRQYRNEAGNIINVPFRDGQPISPIPEGYTFVDPEETATEEVTTTPTTPQTTQVSGEGGDDEARQRREEEMYGPGGGRLGIKGDIYGVSFDGINPLTDGAGLLGGLITGGMIPDDLVNKVTVNLQNPEYGKFTVTGQEYNAIKQKIKTNGANSEETKDFMDDVRRNAAEREAKRRDAAELNRMKELAKTEEMQKLVEKAKETAAVKAAEKERQERIAKAAKEKKQYQSSIFDDPKSDDDGGGSRPGGGGGVSRDVREAVADAGGYTGGGKYGGFASGGLASKPKSKAKKKMKRGGLASKK
jgi:hypothetical protein